VFAYSNAVSLLLFVAAGKVERGPAVVAAVCLPVVALAQYAGSRVAHRVDGDRFRVLVLSLLYMSGLAAIVAAATH
jgi:uncharacterized membrane protein YfcA